MYSPSAMPSSPNLRLHFIFWLSCSITKQWAETAYKWLINLLYVKMYFPTKYTHSLYMRKSCSAETSCLPHFTGFSNVLFLCVSWRHVSRSYRCGHHFVAHLMAMPISGQGSCPTTRQSKLVTIHELRPETALASERDITPLITQDVMSRRRAPGTCTEG
jgi:hypothetical protein